MELYTIHLFAGGGGGILADCLLGHIPICAVEIAENARKVLLQRQLEGILPVFPIWDKVETFTRNETTAQFFDMAEKVKDRLVLCGGFPCQDISIAGKGEGLQGKRSGLWFEFERLIREIRPQFVFVENSPALTKRGIRIILGNLADLGYNASWGVLGAVHVGAPHERKRIWIVAHSGRTKRRNKRQTGTRRKEAAKRQPHSNSPCGSSQKSKTVSDFMRDGTDKGFGKISSEVKQESQRTRRRMRAEPGNICETVSDIDSSRQQQQAAGRDKTRIRPGKICENISDNNSLNADLARHDTGAVFRKLEKSAEIFYDSWWGLEPDVGRLVDGLAYRLDRIGLLGNGQVPVCAAAAFRIFKELYEETA